MLLLISLFVLIASVSMCIMLLVLVLFRWCFFVVFFLGCCCCCCSCLSAVAVTRCCLPMLVVVTSNYLLQLLLQAFITIGNNIVTIHNVLEKLIRNFPDPPATGIFSKVLLVQMGGVLRYKWEAYCGTNWRCIAAFPFLQGLEASEAQRYKWGGLLRYKLEVYCQYFSRQAVRVGGSWTAPNQFWRVGSTPISKKTLREFGLKFWRPTNSESRSERCSENRVFTWIRSWVPFRESLREYPRIPRVAPSMALSLLELFFKIGVVPRFLMNTGLQLQFSLCPG